jgi:hypothetical protein
MRLDLAIAQLRAQLLGVSSDLTDGDLDRLGELLRDDRLVILADTVISTTGRKAGIGRPTLASPRC